MQVGIDSFAAAFDDSSLAANASKRLRNLVEQIEYADQVGLDVFGVGEHHRREFLDSAPVVILGAAAARTRARGHARGEPRAQPRDRAPFDRDGRVRVGLDPRLQRPVLADPRLLARAVRPGDAGARGVRPVRAPVPRPVPGGNGHRRMVAG